MTCQYTRRAAVALSAVVGLFALSGCGSPSDDAAKAAQKFVAGTYREQCELTHPARGGAAKDCQNREDATVWPGHPAEVTATTKWQGDGYAVVIPAADGTRDVFGMHLDGDAWKVAEFDQIDATDDLTDDPACSALDTTGEGC